jgi:Zn finger protein HypA/HybF involved in hydrogenase expression
MDGVRCPYCVEGNGFKIMTPRETHLECDRCGHKVVPDRPTYRCSCPKCIELNRPIAFQTR